MIALMFAGAFSLTFTLLLTPLFIRLFNRLQWGQFIRDDGPQSHHTKRGTPTMGGIVFILGALLGYFFGHIVSGEPVTVSALLLTTFAAPTRSYVGPQSHPLVPDAAPVPVRKVA